MNAWACITTFNEWETIFELVLRLRERGLSVVVSDAASADNTVGMARMAGAHVIEHQERVGIGPALMDAWRYALEQGADRIVQLDAGGSHSPIHVHELLMNPADLVIGSRFLHGSYYGGRPWRAALSRLASAACNLKTGARLTDWTSGYRAFSAKAAWDLLSWRYGGAGHAWQIEVAHTALLDGLTIAEVPITYHAGESSFSWRSALEAFRVWRRL